MRPQYYALAAGEVRVVPLDYNNDGFQVSVQAPGATVEITLDNVWTQAAGAVLWSPAPAVINGVISITRVCSALRITAGAAPSKVVVLQAENLMSGGPAVLTDDQLAMAMLAAYPGQKMWLDVLPSASRFVDVLGESYATTAGQPVGQLLDRAQNYNLGPERVIDGGFANGGASWATVGTQDATHSVTYGPDGMTYVSGTTTPQLSISQDMGADLVGKFVELTVTVSKWTSGQVKVYEQNGQIFNVPGAVGTYKKRFLTQSGTMSVTRASANVNLSLGKISVRELYGIHAGQATAAKRPILGFENGRPYLAADGIAQCLASLTAIDLTGINKVTLIIAVRKRNSDGTYMLTEFGPDFTVGGSFGMYSGQAAPQSYWNFGASGAQNNPTPITASPNVDAAVMVGQVDLNNTNGFSIELTRNADATVKDPTVAGNRNLLKAILNILSRNGTDLFFPGDLYSYMLLAGDYPTPAQLALLKKVSASRMGL